MEGAYVNVLCFSSFVSISTGVSPLEAEFIVSLGRRQFSDKQSLVLLARPHSFSALSFSCQVHLCLSLVFDALLQSL